MVIKAVLFDLDGTLLPMDQDVFVQSYLKRMAVKMAAHGYDAKKLVEGIWAGTGAMVKNDGAKTNEEVFWDVFRMVLGEDARRSEPLLEEFYRNEFQNVRNDCGFHPGAAEIVAHIKSKGLTVILATNPLFPAIATESRMAWAGLDRNDFALYTTYEGSRHCKPNLDYYRDILARMDLKAEECVMVGNDVSEDMIASRLGMQVFLLTDCMINKHNEDISAYPQGSFGELTAFIDSIT